MDAPRHSLLGILSLQSMSGYDIRKFVDENLGHFWKESYGQIYPMLRRMAGQGLVKARVKQSKKGKPDRQVYSLTPSGQAELRAWLAQPPQPPSPRNELLLKLFFGRGMTPDMVAHVERFRSRQRELLQQYSQVETWLHREHSKHPDLRYWLITLDYGKRNAEALVEWSDHTAFVLQQLTESTPEPRRRKKIDKGKKS